MWFFLKELTYGFLSMKSNTYKTQSSKIGKIVHWLHNYTWLEAKKIVTSKKINFFFQILEYCRYRQF